MEHNLVVYCFFFKIINFQFNFYEFLISFYFFIKKKPFDNFIKRLLIRRELHFTMYLIFELHFEPLNLN